MNLLIHIVFAVMLPACTVHASEQREKPNILLMMTDQQSFRSVSSYPGHWGEIHTPRIDALAKAGARFDNFYANHPICTPSRAALFTGRYAWRSGAMFNEVPLKANTRTLADILAKHGYATGYFGKWHLSGAETPGWSPSEKHGFKDNTFMGTTHDKKMEIVDGKVVSSRGAPGDEKSYPTDFLTDRAIEFIKGNEKGPWFCVLSFPDPHDPNTTREPYASRYKPGKMSIPDTFMLSPDKRIDLSGPEDKMVLRFKSDMSSFRKYKAVYCGMVSHIDEALGKVMDTLEQKRLTDSTIVVFTSDHGEMMGEFGKLGKALPYEASARVPFIMRWPGHIPFGLVITTAMSSIDFLPTLLGLAGIAKENEAWDGADYSGLLTGREKETASGISFLILARYVAAVTPRHKLVYTTDGGPWFFDREKDPNERNNSFNSAEYTQVIKEMTRKLKEELQKTDCPHVLPGSFNELYSLRIGEHERFPPDDATYAAKKVTFDSSPILLEMNKVLSAE